MSERKSSSSSNKRQKLNEDESYMTQEPMWEDEEEEEEEDLMGPDSKDYGARGLGRDVAKLAEDVEAADAALSREKWLRPPLPADFDPKSTRITFQQLEIDNYNDLSSKFISSSQEAYLEQPGTILRMYGVTMNGNSVCCHVHHYLPYLYVPCWDGFAQRDLDAFAVALQARLKEATSNQGMYSHVTRHVVSVDVVQKQSVWGYQFNKKDNFLKISLAMAGLVVKAKKILQHGINVLGRNRYCTTYESNLPFPLRFMIDKEMQGCSWIEIQAGTYSVRREPKSTRCQLEIDVSHTNLLAHKPEGEWSMMAPIRTLSFDIECAGRKGVFPTPEEDPVIQIANCVSVQGQSEYLCKNVFTLLSCADIPGSDVISRNTEADMLMEWIAFFRAVDADIITGYNIVNFDLPYLLERAQKLKLKGFNMMGRLRLKPSLIKNKTFQSKAYGIRENKDINIDGRVQFDVIQVVRRDYKLRSYTLNAVSAHFLQQQKEDVHHSIITDLQNGTDETRRRLAVYCIKDAVLPLRLMEKLMMIINYVEMARVTGVPLNYLLTRGQQIKVVSQLYRAARTEDLIIPVMERQNTDQQYTGATVLTPKTGYYKKPIATLDFASLYPSIMMAHNLCYTSLISKKDATEKLKPEDYTLTPNGDVFVKKHLRPGLLPRILTELLGARKNAKRLMKTETDPFKKAVLNGRQLALKVSANSVYGFTGATVGQLPCLAISSSVTAFGRDMIEDTKNAVLKHYTIANGYKHNAEVVYGDTDSVMIKFGVDDVKEAMDLGTEAAVLVTKEFINPIKLEFEKVYFPYLLMNKKRYAGLYWTNPVKWDKMDAKGIETVRRDSCRLVNDVVSTVLHKLLIDRSVDDALNFTKNIMSDLLMNKLDLSLLVISKQLGKSASSEGYTNKVAHVELAERMRKRDPATAPVVGDRVAYVITKLNKGAKAYEKAEDPVYVLENDLPIDTKYYMENQLEGPLTRIFEPIMGNVSQLFHGDHTRKKKISSGGTKKGGIMAFAVKRAVCLGCKVPLSGEEHVVCYSCKGDQGKLFFKQMRLVRRQEEQFSCLWTECQRCQSSLHQEVLCTSRDCPIFYRRIKVQKDLKQAQSKLEMFSFS